MATATDDQETIAQSLPHSLLKHHQNEYTTLQAASKHELYTIPKPSGERGRVNKFRKNGKGRRGYNVRKESRLSKAKWDLAVWLVRTHVSKHAFIKLNYSSNKESCAAVINAVRLEADWLRCYEDNWLLYDLIATYLKNTSEKYRKLVRRVEEESATGRVS
ncbi:hypothetical protein CPB86DRAFT_187351 [Serendipita vermifera]|nr:hypothetical protein CPB86DRAFT_187351 [Serendipita vermifera]